MDTTTLLAMLARSGLPDSDYTAACEQVRMMAARIELADRLAAEMIAASCYLPAGAVSAAIEYVSVYAPSDDAIAA